MDFSTVIANSATSSTSAASSTSSASNAALSATSASDISDRFMKLLVAQMQNQDPLNPADNNQITSQMAQINTVSGISTLNTSMQTLSTQMVGMQALQGASLVGKTVIVPGNQVAVNSSTGAGVGGFNLASAADTVKVDVTNAAGAVVKTINLGALSTGQQSFSFDTSGLSDTTGLKFKVTATSGATTVQTTPLMIDTVDAVSTSGNALQLELDKLGTTPYSSVVSLN